MSTCKACSKPLKAELNSKKSDGSPEDLCNRCLVGSYDEGSYAEDKEYYHGQLVNSYYSDCDM